MIKNHLFELKFSNLIFFWRTRTPTRVVRHDKCSKNFIFDHFFEYGKLRAQVRARKFGAHHRIEHHHNNILCIYNIFISLEVADIEWLEVFRSVLPIVGQPTSVLFVKLELCIDVPSVDFIEAIITRKVADSQE